jgi:uncharacterized Zn finger protein (UPF0148 family)
MKNCKKCGETLKDESKFCPNCGESVSIESQKESEKYSTSTGEIDRFGIQNNQHSNLNDIMFSKNPQNSRLESDPFMTSSQSLNQTVSAVQEKKRSHNKVLWGLVILTLLTFSYFYYEYQREQQYISDLNEVIGQMYSGALMAEKILDTTSTIWYNAIFKVENISTNRYTKGFFGFNDFDTAINKYYADTDTINQLSKIDKLKSEIADLMIKLRNPPEKYKLAYETVLDLHIAYKQIVSLAESPTGNLSGFNSDKSQRIGRFIQLVNKLDSIIPK